jgi:hypothetical protein
MAKPLRRHGAVPHETPASPQGRLNASGSITKRGRRGVPFFRLQTIEAGQSDGMPAGENEGLIRETTMAPNTGNDEADLANGDLGAYIHKMDRRLIVLETRFDTILPTLATKADLIELRAELKADMSKLGADLRAEMASLRTEVHAFKADIFKWMVATLLTIFLGFSGMIITMITLLRPG